MKWFVCLLAIFTCLAFTSCSDSRAKAVDEFNSNTLEEIARYDAVKSIAEGKEQELITGIMSADLSAFPVSDELDLSEAQKVLSTLVIPDVVMDKTPLIQSSDFYTSLETDTVTQYITFTYCGISLKLQILWTDKIELVTLEVRNG